MEKIFANGFYFRMPSPEAPDFVLGKLSIRKSEALEFINSQEGDWINCDIKRSKAGDPYIEVNTWKPKKTEKKETKPDNSDLPF